MLFRPCYNRACHSNTVDFFKVANHVTSDDRVHGISENKLLNSGNIFLDIFVNTCQN